jgi:hypothetical protein
VVCVCCEFFLFWWFWFCLGGGKHKVFCFFFFFLATVSFAWCPLTGSYSWHWHAYTGVPQSPRVCQTKSFKAKKYLYICANPCSCQNICLFPQVNIYLFLKNDAGGGHMVPARNLGAQEVNNQQGKYSCSWHNVLLGWALLCSIFLTIIFALKTFSSLNLTIFLKWCFLCRRWAHDTGYYASAAR